MKLRLSHLNWHALSKKESKKTTINSYRSCRKITKR
jgi:hypothetical protein